MTRLGECDSRLSIWRGSRRPQIVTFAATKPNHCLRRSSLDVRTRQDISFTFTSSISNSTFVPRLAIRPQRRAYEALESRNRAAHDLEYRFVRRPARPELAAVGEEPAA